MPTAQKIKNFPHQVMLVGAREISAAGIETSVPWMSSS